MYLSVSQWLASFVLDVLIKSVFLAFLGMFTFGGPLSFILAAVPLSIFHFICIFLGYTAAIALELVRLKLSPGLAFWLGIVLANVLFGVALNAFLALIVSPGTTRFFEPSPTTVWLVITNFVSIVVVAAYRFVRADQALEGS